MLFLNFISIRKLIDILKTHSQTNSGNKTKIADITTKNINNSVIKTPVSLLPHQNEPRVIIDDLGEQFKYTVHLHKILVGALVGGLISGLFGVGGGIIYVPVLTNIGGLPLHLAVATSTFTILLGSTSSSIARIIGGKVLWEFVIPLAIGTVYGAKIGATNVRKVSNETILLLFYVLVFVSGIRIFFCGLGIF